MASHTIASTNSGVTLLPAGYYNPVTVEAGIIVSSPSIAIDAPTEWTVYNLGTVTDTGTAGILLEQGGTVINGQSGSTVAAAYIGGAGEAIDITGAAGSVANYGTIHGAGDGVFLEQGGAVTNGASGATSAGITGSSGVNVANVSGTVSNDGTISGTSGDGVFLGLGGNVINGAANPTASAALITGSSYGIDVRGNGGTVTNYGTVQSPNGYGARLYGGALINGTAGTSVALISGGGGVLGYQNTVDVTNYGTITGLDDAVALNNGGSINNAQESAAILGDLGGVDIFGGGTVDNLGTIIGTTLHGIYLFDGGNVTNGQPAATISPALISGGYYGIRIGFHNGAAGTVTNYGTVIATGSHPFPPTSQYSAVLIDGTGSVANSGIIRANANNSFDRAIRLNNGGNVSNSASGTIAGDGTGIYVVGAAGTVSNAGSISGVNSNGGEGVYLAAGGTVDNTATAASIRGAAVAIYISGATGTVSNIGTITGFGPLDSGLSTAEGVGLNAGGSVTNGVSGSSGGYIYGYDSAVFIDGPTNGGSTLGTGTVTNFGTIIGRSQFGIELREGGVVTNGASGVSPSAAYVYGGSYGVVTDFAESGSATHVYGTVMNFGTVVATASNGAGVALRSGVVVVNAAGATITGGYGISAFGYGSSGPTVVNAGTIHATGPNHFAVFFQTGNDLLVDVPGAVFDGTVVTGGSALLELASAASIGTLTGLGTDFSSFDTVTVAPSAQWNVSGSNSVASGTGIVIGSSADLEITGSLSGAADFMLRGGTLGVANAVDAGAIFDFTDPAGLSPDQLTLSAVSGVSFDNAITGFGGLDEIAVPNVTFAAGSTPIIGAGAVTVDLQAGGTFTFSSFAFQSGVPETLIVGAHSITDAACFAAGTMIRTEQGEVAVESLQPGDRLITHNGAMRTVRWIGNRRIDFTRHPDPSRAQPIRIRRDAIATGMPSRDLLVSPDHALYIDGGLVVARLLLNGGSIVREANVRAVQYFHVELDAHDILFADGMPAESYLDTGNRSMFENAGLPLILHPDLSGQQCREVASCAPFVTNEATLRSLWYRLAERAESIGHPAAASLTTDDPAPSLVVAGKRLRPVLADDGRYVFAVPHGGGEVRLVSRASAPCDAMPWIEDRRSLGIMLRRVTLHCGDSRQDIAADHPMLGAGWWPVERGDGDIWRWSDGDAALRLPADTSLLEIHIGQGKLHRAESKLRAA